jgi:hypothetical protein
MPTICLLLLLALALPGCFVPIPSIPGEAPYGETIDFLVAGSTTREEVLERLGPAPVSRQEGHLLIYGAARETAGRILAITIVPMTIPLEELHFLFLEFDDDGVLRHSELSIAGSNANDACDSHGHCIAGSEWEIEGAIPFWVKSGDIRHGERALVTASHEEEQVAREMKPAEHGCLVYFFSKRKEPDWVDSLLAKTTAWVYYAVDSQPRFTDINSHYFAVWRLAAGSHTIRAMERDGDPVADFSVDCVDGRATSVVAQALPTVFGASAAVEFSVIPPDVARAEMQDRRMLLTH